MSKKNEGKSEICKVVLLGESSVGKTCIITRFVDDEFDKEIISTTGASYANKTLKFKDYNNKEILFEIWDTAGQEKYRSLTQLFYKDASIAILVYDITNEESYNELKNYWVNQIIEFAPKDISIILFIFLFK
jgi:small GTP-binding protein